MYRAFVHCDDPKGVAKFGFGRTSHPKKKEGVGRRNSKTKEIATDLIKEALHLQESLAEFQKMLYLENQKLEIGDSRNRNEDGDDRSLAMVWKRRKEGPNLIARLMGLEEMPMPLPMKVNQLQGGIRRSMLDVDPAMTKKSMEKLCKDGKTLKDLFKSGRREGLSPASSTTGSRPCDVSCVDGRVEDDVLPALVLIKPYAPKGIKAEKKDLADEFSVQTLDHVKSKNSRGINGADKVPCNQNKVSNLKNEAHAVRRFSKPTKTSDYNTKETAKSKTPKIEIEIDRKKSHRCEESAEMKSDKTRNRAEKKNLRAKLLSDYTGDYLDGRSVWKREEPQSCDKQMEEFREWENTKKKHSIAGDNEDCNAMLGMELGLKEALIGNWELGWRPLNSSQDVPLSVADIANLLLIDLIKELLALLKGPRLVP